MARYSGTAMVIVFGGATVSGLFSSLEANEEVATIDVTAGADQHEETIFDVVSDRISMTLLHSSGTAGSAAYTALAPKSSGTLVFHPSGTAATNSHHTYTDAKVISRSLSVPRGDKVEFSAELISDVVEAVTYT